MLNCREMNGLISLYLDDKLDGTGLAGFEEHVNSCMSCKKELDGMMRVIKLCRSMPQEDIPEGFKEELHLKLAAEKERQEKRSRIILLRNKYIAICTSAAAVLLLFFAAKGIFGNMYFQPAKYTALYDNDAGSKSKNIDITISADKPDMEAEKIKTSASAYGAEFLEEMPSGTSSAFTVSEQKDRQTESGSADKIELRFKIPDVQYERFVNSLKAGLDASDLKFGEIVLTDLKNRTTELEGIINKLNSKINEIEGSGKTSDPEVLNKLKQERENAQTELEGIRKDSKYIFVTVLITF